MLFKLLFTDLPEFFYTVNLTPGILLPVMKFGPLTITLVSGLVLISAGLLVFSIFHFKKKLSEKKFQAILLSLIALAWLPLYLNFTYNNLYDLSENYKALKQKKSGKLIIRACGIDHRQNLGGIFCGLFSFFTFTKNSLPPKSEVKLLAAPGTEIFFHYYLYPDYKIVDQADYLLFYYSGEYYYKNGLLYKRQPGGDAVIGKYQLAFMKNANEFILKKP